MSEIFTEEQFTRLSDEIDKQLIELQNLSVSGMKGGEKKTPGELPEKQCEIIKKNTGEQPETFLKKFTVEAKKDLCEEDGMLYKQWKKWSDLSNKDVLQSFGSVLVGMGIGAGNLEILAVAVGVVVIHIGVRVICKEYTKNENAS
ncbi:hypothetical protein QUF75_09280 [Desulfococcaceae bacterium HSG7]|nr:hypothetical protein [Desulfococcaceae bacterium HSG7]